MDYFKKTALKSGFFLIIMGVLLAVACKNPAGRGPTPPPDKTALNEAIREAEELYNKLEISENGKDIDNDQLWVESIEKNRLFVALDTARTIAANSDATPEQIQLALDELNEAYGVVDPLKQWGTRGNILRNELRDMIATAKILNASLETSSQNGNDIPPIAEWVTGDIKTGLTNAIADAEALIAKTDASSEELQAALDTLNAAYDSANDAKDWGTTPDKSQLDAKIRDARQKMQDVYVSHAGDGGEFKQNEYWVSVEANAVLTAALDAGITVNEDDAATVNEVNNALETLITALNGYDPQPGISVADKDGLNALIDLVQEALDKVRESENGLDVYTTEEWATAAERNALETVLDEARIIAGNWDALQADVDEMALTLQAAFDGFKPRKGQLQKGDIGYTFDGPADENITLGGDQSISWADNNTLTIGVGNGYGSYRWYVDGTLVLSGETEITLFARDYNQGSHTLTLRVTKDEAGSLVPYTKTLTFTVY